MDELLHLNLLEEMEEAEIDVEDFQMIERPVGDPFAQLSNSVFLRIFRMSKELCQFLINSLEPYMTPSVRSTDLDIPLKVLVALRFFASGSYQMDVRFFEQYNIPGIVGCIDCTHVAIFPPKIEDLEYPEHLYVNRKGYHSIDVQLVCDNALKIMNVNARYPGSTNDAFIWNNSNLQILLRHLHMAGYKDYYLLEPGFLHRWMKNQYPTPQNIGIIQHTRARGALLNAVLKMRFRCLLKHRVLHYAPQMACKIIIAVLSFHNLCIENRMPEIEEENNDFDFGMLQNERNIVNDRIERIQHGTDEEIEEEGNKDEEECKKAGKKDKNYENSD
ncbi:hypothetical protein NQ314_012425 [Rhamnusium bicolor]|uniref:DDE Tnp4 domain-containing protein n=1 Tax=Rhamnusium bicolor TaxID=1586634 RepID=A0AAV8XBI9_9CUCU|nr:hypothetical protein NQ314_012425 [Rhamnusium bicolor]